MLGLFPIAGAPIAGSGDSPNTNGGAASGTSTLTASGTVAGAGAGSGTASTAAAGAVVGAGNGVGNSTLTAFQVMAQIRATSSLGASGAVAGRGAGSGTSVTGASGAVASTGGHIEGESTLQAFAFYPAYKSWEAEIKLFDYNGPLIEESDSAFEQAGRIIFCAQRTILGRQEVWLYWFDPIVGGFTFEFISVGRNPRVILDDPFDTTNSDVLLFYIRLTDQRVVYRQQRDRFLIEYETPMVKVPHSYVDLYLQDVVKDRSGRLVIIVGLHTINTGRWKYGRLESALYPFVLELEEFTAVAPKFLSGSGLDSVRKSVFILNQIPDPLDGVPVAWLVEEKFTAAVTFTNSGLLNVVLIEVAPHGSLKGDGTPVAFETSIDEFKVPTVVFQSGSLPVVIIQNVLYDIDEFTAAASYQSGSLIRVVIDFILYDIDEFQASVTFQSTGSSLAP